MQLLNYHIKYNKQHQLDFIKLECTYYHYYSKYRKVKLETNSIQFFFFFVLKYKRANMIENMICAEKLLQK